MTDWDAARYDRVSEPQVEWGRRVILRLAPRLHERVLDLGCGTGRLTAGVAEFIACVCIRHHLDRLPESLRNPFALELTRAAEADAPPFTLDYWRLNIDAIRPPA